MKKTYGVLIVEDHIMMVENYNTALSYYAEEHRNVLFETEQANNCQEAYDKINDAVIGGGLDIVILDIRLKPTQDFKIRSGVDLGVMVRKLLPKATIVVITFHDENEWLSAIIDAMSPDSFVIKSDVNNHSDLVNIIAHSVAGKSLYSHRVLTYLKHKNDHIGFMDAVDMDILRELANGAKLSELEALIVLSRSGIEKRIRNMKKKLGIPEGSNRDLALLARKKLII